MPDHPVETVRSLAEKRADRPEASGTLAVQSILDLERDFDHNDAPIYVESRREHDGKPQV